MNVPVGTIETFRVFPPELQLISTTCIDPKISFFLLFASHHHDNHREGFQGRREKGTYSGLWPTSTNATSGLSAAENAAWICGNAARTSGHQDWFVVGSVDEMKAMKNGNLEPLGNVRRFGKLGTEKLVETGMFAVRKMTLGGG